MPGVFAIYACSSRSETSPQINPAPEDQADNFTIFGCGVSSFWAGRHLVVSGTSFATPVAVAIAANVLEYARCQPASPGGRLKNCRPENVVDALTRYNGMAALFREHMVRNKSRGIYHLLHPWIRGLWDDKEDHEAILGVLFNLST